MPVQKVRERLRRGELQSEGKPVFPNNGELHVPRGGAPNPPILFPDSVPAMEVGRRRLRRHASMRGGRELHTALSRRVRLHKQLQELHGAQLRRVGTALRFLHLHGLGMSV